MTLTHECPHVTLYGGPYDGGTVKAGGSEIIKMPTGLRVHRYLVLHVWTADEDGIPYEQPMAVHESMQWALGVNIAGIFDAIDNA
jgi:hypothetical protein